MKKLIYFSLGLSLITACSRDDTPVSPYLLFPAGRSVLASGELTVWLNGTEYQPKILFDSCGGYWLKIPKADLPASGKITFVFTRKKVNSELYKEAKPRVQKWLDESIYIDAFDEKIKTKAIALTQGYLSRLDKARQIHLFVKSNMQLQFYHDAFQDKASRTYNLLYGECMNYSRLYIAMCRAANIPARSVWGVIYGYNNDNIYDYHHQWAEVLDDNGQWHPSDFKYTTNFELNDIRYLALVYAAEENTIIKERLNDELVLGDVHYFNDYPATLTGRLGFELVEDKRPDYMSVKYTYTY